MHFGTTMAFGTLLASLVACQSEQVAVDYAKRTMGVTAGPELVFTRPVQQLLPVLNGARATSVNGRVGNELVFWGYQLENGDEAWLFACAPLDGVDCNARTRLICPAGNTRVVTQTSEDGMVRELDCQAVGQAGIGDLRPGCTDTQKLNPLLVGLAACN
jgi:hypothetical protein